MKQFLWALFFCLLLAGCTTIPVIEAECTVPPDAIEPLPADAVVAISAEVKFSGATPEEEAFLKSCLAAALQAKLNAEGYYRTADALYGNPAGVAMLQKQMQVKNLPHGYALYSTPPVKPYTFALTFEGGLKSKQEVKSFDYKLSRTPYHIIYNGSVPSSVPGLTTWHTEHVRLPVHTLSASGKLRAVLSAPDGTILYDRSWDATPFRFETDVKKAVPPPTPGAVLAGLALPLLDPLVRQISPHREYRKLQLDPHGDPGTVALLRAGAIPEALRRTPRTLTAADCRNLAAGYEILGDYPAAAAMLEDALKRNPADTGVISADIERLGKLTERRNRLKQSGSSQDNRYQRPAMPRE